MKHRSKVHQYDHLIRLARRRALAGSKTARKRYYYLCDNTWRLCPPRHLYYRSPNAGPVPQEPHHGAARIYKLFKEMGYKCHRMT